MLKMKSDLELMVEYDMYTLGFDPSNYDDVVAYWDMMLS